MSIDSKFLQAVKKGSVDEGLELLLDFNLKHEKHKNFKEIDSKTKQLLWDSIFYRMTSSNCTAEIIKAGLNSLRILSREKETLDAAMTDDRVLTLLDLSGLKVTIDNPSCKGDVQRPKSVEGLKVIFNMVFQSSTLQIVFISHGVLDCLIKRVEDFTNDCNEYPEEYQYFVVRILFLITALCQDTAPAKVRNLLNGLVILNNFLESKYEKYQQQPNQKVNEVTSDIICETLKVLYSLLADIVPKNMRNNRCTPSVTVDSNIDDDDLEQLKRTTKLSRVLLTNKEISTSCKIQEIHRHSVEILAAIPPSCFHELIPKCYEDESQGSSSSNKNVKYEFEGLDLSAVESAVQFLDSKLDEVKKGAILDNVAPPLCALHNMASGHRAIRKYLKQRILPPLNRDDLINLPEKGKTIRNKLCSLLTSPVTHITELVANLLFILCKENVRKLIKYTGYGNAAGLLANRGLMLGGDAPVGKYSDTEEESDTEEYKEIEHLINQVEGRIQLDRPDPMEGMTDEQKEFEAMKLINAIDKMERNSAIKPCKIGPDGRPEPILHVLQLQEALENPMKGLRRDDDSDSDSDY